MISLKEFETFIENDIVYEQHLLYYIDDLGRENLINNVGHLHSVYDKCIKIEGLEKYNKNIFEHCKSFLHYGPVTCHGFRSFKNSKSFPKHTDPDDVYIKVIHGDVSIVLKDIEYNLKNGDTLYIPSNTEHKAINKEESLILSFGLEKFLIDKI